MSFGSDPTSTYALQVALKGMKERYQKVQKKINILEEENIRLVTGKTDLFNEIGKMQESSIRLREKNLHLNQEVHAKEQKMSDLESQISEFDEELSKLQKQLARLQNDNGSLASKLADLNEEKRDLENALQAISQRCRLHVDTSSSRSKLANEVLAIANNGPTPSSSMKILHTIPLESYNRTKIFPQSDDFKDLEDDFEKIEFCDSLLADGSSPPDLASASLEAVGMARDALMQVAARLRSQKAHLQQAVAAAIVENDKKYTKLSDSSQDAFRATYTTTSQSNCTSSSQTTTTFGGGETNVLVEEMEVSPRVTVAPFDWRNLEVEEDETTLAPDPKSDSKSSKISTRTVSTSPDPSLLSPTKTDDEERTCPMCNALFPTRLTQEAFENHVVSHFENENGFEVIA